MLATAVLSLHLMMEIHLAPVPPLRFHLKIKLPKRVLAIGVLSSSNLVFPSLPLSPFFFTVANFCMCCIDCVEMLHCCKVIHHGLASFLFCWGKKTFFFGGHPDQRWNACSFEWQILETNKNWVVWENNDSWHFNSHCLNCILFEAACFTMTVGIPFLHFLIFGATSCLTVYINFVLYMDRVGLYYGGDREMWCVQLWSCGAWNFDGKASGRYPITICSGYYTERSVRSSFATSNKWDCHTEFMYHCKSDIFLLTFKSKISTFNEIRVSRISISQEIIGRSRDFFVGAAKSWLAHKCRWYHSSSLKKSTSILHGTSTRASKSMPL